MFVRKTLSFEKVCVRNIKSSLKEVANKKKSTVNICSSTKSKLTVSVSIVSESRTTHLSSKLIYSNTVVSPERKNSVELSDC